MDSKFNCKAISLIDKLGLFKYSFELPFSQQSNLYLDLGVVKHIARVKVNKRDLGIVWTAPWKIKIPAGALKSKGNQLIVEVTSVWANRLIGDEQEPGSNYFAVDSPLISSGLLGPVKIIKSE